MDVLLPVLGGEDIVDVIAEKVRRQDNPLLGHPLMRWLDDPDETVVGRRLSSACYVEDALPSTAYLALKYHDDPCPGAWSPTPTWVATTPAGERCSVLCWVPPTASAPFPTPG
jgi:hypothetical protein